MVRWGGEHAQVVAEVVVPLLTEQTLDGRSSYVDTDWWQGPHVSLCFRATADEVKDLRATGLVGRAQELLSNLGAGPDTAPEQYRDLHARLARYERRPGPLEPWLPDGLALLRPLPPREDGGGGGDLGHTVQQAHTVLREVEIELFARIAREELRVEAHSLDLLASVAVLFTDSDLRATYPSFASHAEAYLAMDAAAGTRERWDEAYMRHQSSLIRLLEQRTHQASDGALPPAVAAVTGILTAVADATDPLALFGGSALPVAEAFSSSAFHTELSRNHKWQDTVRHDAWFARYRLLLNLAYRHLSKLGLTPHHRFYTCYLLTRAAQDLTHTTATDVLKGLSRA